MTQICFLTPVVHLTHCIASSFCLLFFFLSSFLLFDRISSPASSREAPENRLLQWQLLDASLCLQLFFLMYVITTLIITKSDFLTVKNATNSYINYILQIIHTCHDYKINGFDAYHIFSCRTCYTFRSRSIITNSRICADLRG